MKKNILKIAAATASAIITLAFLSCTQGGGCLHKHSTKGSYRCKGDKN
ncbi:MAG: hypothetical protein SO369_01305 [Treponema sp.]|nr:hypothetical protein [Treponema sp.]